VRLSAARPRAVVAFSGGKDSTAAVLLLREQGHEVRALTMRLGLAGEGEHLARAEALARAIDVPWRAVDLEVPFRQCVLDHFVAAYGRGLTPNPCVACNRRIKFGLLLEKAAGEAAGALFATGHYADKALVDGRWLLKEPAERRKSQVYFLAAIEPRALAGAVFPLAGMTVAQVRRRVAGLPLANSEESQDACFLQGEALDSFLGRRLPGGLRPGRLLDAAGAAIGEHDGALSFTVGQRRGTRHAGGRRLYVVRRDLDAGTVTLGGEKDLLSLSLTAAAPVYWRPLRSGEALQVKVRYEAHGHEAEVREATAARIRVVFREPVRAVTPGQLAVLYDGDLVVAAAEIVGA
jgi:tRNA-specific 2-thiouridylase